MDIRTKFVLALVAVSLGGMLALGWFTYGAARQELRTASLRQLEAMAASKAQAVDNLFAGWLDRVGLIGSRTQLRISLRDHGAAPTQALRSRIERIVEDVVVSVPSVRRLRVYDAGNRLVVDTPQEGSGTPPSGSGPIHGSTGIAFQGLAVTANGDLEAHFHAPLTVDGQSAGALEVALSADQLRAVSEDYSGLAATGETLIGQVVGDSVLVLSGLRHAGLLPLSRSVPLDRVEDPLVQAALGVEETFEEGALDYRGRAVWAATRFLTDPGWGIVVKLDQSEEIGRVVELRREMLRLATALSAFAILFGVVLGLRFARPIHDLAEVADRIGRGELDARADVRSEDEIGILADTFNRMAEQLIETNRTLRRQVEDTRELEAPPSDSVD